MNLQMPPLHKFIAPPFRLLLLLIAFSVILPVNGNLTAQLEEDDYEGVLTIPNPAAEDAELIFYLDTNWLGGHPNDVLDVSLINNRTQLYARLTGPNLDDEIGEGTTTVGWAEITDSWGYTELFRINRGGAGVLVIILENF